MSYEATAAVADLDTLLDNLMDFAAANGFTKETTLTGTGETTDMYILSRSGMYWWFIGRSLSDGEFGSYGVIDMRMQKTAPTVANRENVIADAPSVEGQRELTRCFLSDNTNGSYTNTYFHADSNVVHAAIELSSGVYTHLSFGVINKYGSWTGGEFLTATHVSDIASEYAASTGFSLNESYTDLIFGGNDSANGITGYVYYPYETQGDERDWAAFHTAAVDTEGRRVRPMATIAEATSPIGDLLAESPNTFNSRSVMLPTYLFMRDNRATVGTLKYILIGDVTNARIVNMNLIDAGSTIYEGWVVYPQFQKSGDEFKTPITDWRGIAIKKVT